MSDQPEKLSYDEPIRVLVGLKPVRLRPGMFIGDTDAKGYHHLAFEIIDNAVAEVMAGYCTTITVTLHNERTLTIEDDGSGIPMVYDEKEQLYSLEGMLSYLRWSWDHGYCQQGYKVSGSLHGVGLPIVNALTEAMTIDTFREGTHYRIECAKGELLTPVQQLGPTSRHGTVVTMTPDREMFGDTITFSPKLIRDYLCHLAYLLPAAQLIFRNKVSRKTTVFHTPDGITQWVKDKNRKLTVLHPIVHAAQRTEGILAEVAFQYHSGKTSRMARYANATTTYNNSAEAVGFYAGLITGINAYAESLGLLPPDQPALSEEDIGTLLKLWNIRYEPPLSCGLTKRKGKQLLAQYRHGLTAIISVWVLKPKYIGSIKGTIGNTEVISLVRELTRQAVIECCTCYPEILRELIAKGLYS